MGPKTTSGWTATTGIAWLRKIGFTEEDLQIREIIDSTDIGESMRDASALVEADHMRKPTI